MKKGMNLVLVLLLVVYIPAHSSAGAASRLSGANRFETAIAISRSGWPSAEKVVLARGDDFADALAGVPLAYSLDAPILLSGRNALDPAIKAEIQRLGANHAVLLGGVQAIDKSVETALTVLGLTVERVYGRDRYETAIRIAQRLPWRGKRAFLASGLNFPDALAAAPYAAKLGSPILLTGKNMPSGVMEVLRQCSEIIVVGGTGIISDEQIQGLQVKRFGGSDRYSTALTLLKHFGVGEQVYVASGLDFADAVTGAVLAAKGGAGIMLTGSSLPSGYKKALAGARGAVIIGGKKAVPEEIITELDQFFQPGGSEGKEPDIITAVSRTNTETVLILSQVPRQLFSPADITLEPRLNVLSVTVNDNVVTLVTEPQTTVTYQVTIPGGSSNFFLGKKAVDTGGLAAVKLENLCSLRLDFTEPLLWEDCRELRNYYIGLAEEGTGNLQAASLAFLLGSAWEVIPGQEGPYVDRVYIQSAQGVAMDCSLGVGYGSIVCIEIRNLRDKSGSYIHTSYGQFGIFDNASPQVINAEVKGDRLYIRFSEPLGIDYDPARGFSIYLGGKELSAATLVPKESLSEQDSVPYPSLLVFDLGGYDPGEYALSVVGAKDLCGNLQTPSLWQGRLTIPVLKAEPPLYDQPKVVGVHQVADNMLEILFNQPGVEYRGMGPAVTIKNAILDGKCWRDLVIDMGDSDSIDPTGVWGSSGFSKWVVAYPVNYNQDDGSGFTYNGNEALRDVVVENFRVVGNPPELAGSKTVIETVFTFDRLSPSVSRTWYNVEAGSISLGFLDEPFHGIIQPGAGLVQVRRTDNRGVTHVEYISLESGRILFPDKKDGQFAGGQYLEILLPLSKLTDSAGRLLEGSIYTVELPQGFVLDANRQRVVGFSPEVKITGFQPVPASQVSVAVMPLPKGEGRVPQTATGLIQTGWDMQAGVSAVTLSGNVARTGSVQYMLHQENLNKIIIVFDGAVEAASAVNKLNYSMNGKPLPLETDIRFFTQEGLNENVYGIEGLPGGDIGFVLVHLPANTIPVSGSYLFMVDNVCSPAGKRMLPVKAIVRLVDNTQPQIQSIFPLGSRQIGIRFDEPIRITDKRSVENLQVFIDGLSYTAESLTPAGDDLCILTLGKNIQSFSRITLITTGDCNNLTWIYDLYGNQLLSGQTIQFCEAFRKELTAHYPVKY